MAFWDSIKKIFGGGLGQGGSGADSSVRAQMVAFAKANQSFTSEDVANVLGMQVHQVQASVDAVFDAGELEPYGYRRLVRPTEATLFNTYSGTKPGEALRPPAPPVQRSSGLSRAVSAPAPSAPSKPAASRDYASNPEILGLSADELRKRALKVNPYQTAWIGRVDAIPPQSDDRTAYIDRGLILRGLLNGDQIAEIHEVGDLWIRHYDALNLVRATATKSADAAIEQAKQEKAAGKAAKKAAAKAKAEKRKEEIAKRRAEDIIFLGIGVSRGLADRRVNVERLQAAGLPMLSTPADVAKALGLTISKLRWLCFHAEATETVHYIGFEVPKRSGGTRRIAAPHQMIAAAQQWVLENILAKVPLQDRAHGFVTGRSTVTNAKEHVGRGLVINLDLKEFFPSITFPRVLGAFKRLGYSPASATVLALLCTESPRQEAVYNGKVLHVAVGPRALPQGACTSPALSNVISRKFDARLAGRAKKLGFHYTRYADDLTFSRPEFGREGVAFLMAMARHVVQEEGFALNPKKGRVQVNAGRQMVTGVVVNQKLSIPREDRRRLRAVLHQAKKTGLEAQNTERHPNFRQHVEGLIAYFSMVNAEQGAQLKKMLAQVTAP